MVAPHRSAIGWTDYSGGDANFVTGCTPVSAGCRNCYARAIYERYGRDFSQVQVHGLKLYNLYRWKPSTPWKRDRPMCFVCDTGDLLHDEVPAAFIATAVDLMRERQDIEWQVLTKRLGRIEELLGYIGDWPSNIWLGVSVENQATADERIPLLLQVPAAVRFVSVEPCLEKVNLGLYDLRRNAQGGYEAVRHGLNWVICGAESGPNRRPFDVDWAVGLYEQCREEGVPFFFKQSSALRPGQDDELPGIGSVKEWPNGI